MAKKRPRRKGGLIYTPLSFLLIVTAMFLGISVFFKITDIEVEGIGIYTQEEITEASGLRIGENLFFINRQSASMKIMSSLPYVDEAVVRRQLPNKVVITVSESRAMVVLKRGKEMWQLDKSCKVLDKISSNEAGEMIVVSGIETEDPVVGEMLKGADAEQQKIGYLSALLKSLMSHDMSGDITAIDFENVANPTFDYLGRFRVKLGKNENVDYKLDMLHSAAEQLAPGDEGTIDLSENQKAHFTPN